MKKLLSFILVLALSAALLLTPAGAANYATAVVKGGWLILRAEPSAESETVSAYFTGTTVTILGGSGEWYLVLTPDGKTGYMNSAFLTITGSITGGQLDENTQGVVVSSNGKPVRLRSGPSVEYAIVASYPVGTPLTILSSGDTWCKIRIEGRTGYMMTDFISVSGTGSSGTATGGYTAYVTAENGLNCVMRSGPSKLYDAIASYPVGTQVTVIQYGSTWSQLRVGELEGYMMSRYLTTVAPDVPVVPPSTTQIMYVTSANGLGVRLRSGASKLFPTIATYEVGTQVTLIEYGKTWCKIRIGNQTGYMMTEFLTYTAPSRVLSVKISTANAKPGDTLRAVVSPSNADVSISWVNDLGRTLAYGEMYTVQTSDIGRKVRASVVGIGATSGSDTSGWCTVSTGSYVEEVYYLTGVTISDTTPTAGQTLTAQLRPSGATANVSWYWENGAFIGSGMNYTVRDADVGHNLYVKATGTGNTSGEVTSSVTYAVEAAAAPTIALQSVYIDDTTPTVGQTLTAKLYPANATASFTWRCSDGRILGYGSTFTVTEEENGKTLYVYANGTGNTSGSVVSNLTSAVTGAPAAQVRIDSVTLSDLTPTVGQTLIAVVNPSNASATLTWLRDDDVILAYGNTYTVRAADEGHTIYVWAEGINGAFGSATSKITEIITR